MPTPASRPLWLVILGLSLANWACLVFVAALAAGAWALWRGWHPTHS